MDNPTLASATLTLLLVMDPIGNVPVFLGILKNVDERRRSWIVMRESLFALLILSFFLFFGPSLMNWLHIGVEALHIAGGVLLFIISLGMIFPNWMRGTLCDDAGGLDGEPFIVPLATPLLAGPSTMATIMIFTSKQSQLLGQWTLALGIAWVISTLILLLAHRLSRILGTHGLTACERLMGMILTVIAVQMFLDGVRRFLDVAASVP
jgi:multiple antibiotic resistance protein